MQYKFKVTYEITVDVQEPIPPEVLAGRTPKNLVAHAVCDAVRDVPFSRYIGGHLPISVRAEVTQQTPNGVFSPSE